MIRLGTQLIVHDDIIPMIQRISKRSMMMGRVIVPPYENFTIRQQLSKRRRRMNSNRNYCSSVITNQRSYHCPKTVTTKLCNTKDYNYHHQYYYHHRTCFRRQNYQKCLFSTTQSENSNRDDHDDSSHPNAGSKSNSSSNNRRYKETYNNIPIESLTKKMELDFFGEPVTFIYSTNQSDSNNATRQKIKSDALAAMDGFLLCVLSKGLTCTMGGDEGGLEIKSAHASAITWTEALLYAMIWNNNNQNNNSNNKDPPLRQKDKQQPDDTNNDDNDDDEDDDDDVIPFASVMIAPMLAVVTVAPILVQTGIAYVKHLDTMLLQCKTRVKGLPPIQMMDIATNAIEYYKNSNNYQDHKTNESNIQLNERECMHLQALDYLLQNQYPTALYMYLKILRSCPGDALAMSLAMDLSHTLGDKQAALRATGSIASYWNERRGGLIRPAIPGHAMISSLMALGFVVGGNRDEDAEQMAERAMKDGKKVCGALATWAQVHIFDARGRIAEGISACANFDGIANYEGAGFLFFDCRLGGYGARFSLDREERGRGKSTALRLYEANFARPLGYSGFSQGQLFSQPLYRSPISWAEKKSIESKKEPTLLDRLLGRKPQKQKEKLDYELVIKQVNTPSTEFIKFEPSCEDVLTWLPPTPALLSDATLLLLRFTLNGTISPRNTRWDNIRNGWAAMLEMQKKHGLEGIGLTFSPLYCVTASLLYPPSQTGGDKIGTGRLAEGLYMMGEILNLGNPVTEVEKNYAVREIVAENDPYFWLPAKMGQTQEWKKILGHLASAIDGLDYNNSDDDIDNTSNLADPTGRFNCWDFEARPILEHAICFAACKAGDTESLSLARSICSQGVTLRGVSPEEWWRYSIVLGLLGDEVGSEDALNNSINTGSGQGARR